MKNSAFKKLVLGASFTLASFSAFSFTSTPTPPPPPMCVDDTSIDHTRGPNPTASMLEAENGPYSVNTIDVSSDVSGFGGGTIHYPAGTSGKMGAIAIVSGFLAPESDIIWWAPRLASHGFVVITIETNGRLNNEDSRAGQLSAALDYVVSESNASSNALNGKVDACRLGAMGWSMGGGGTLELATRRDLKATIPQAPYYSGSNDFDTITAPTFIMACENDGTAGVDNHALPFYNTIPATTDKALLVIAGGSHSCGTSGNANEGLMGKYAVAWMKRFIDVDTRYDQFLCGPNHTDNSAISDYKDNCNY
jgi:dienelactone hydrolase